MVEKQESKNQPLPPHAQLVQMATAHWVSHIAYVAAKMNLADHLAKGPQSADTLAGLTGTHGPSLYRLMRTLANLGMLTEDVSHRFALTPLGEAPAAIASAYDFSAFKTIVDVGGATGNLLTTILGRYPKSNGMLYDLPHVVRDAPALIQARGLTDRV